MMPFHIGGVFLLFVTTFGHLRTRSLRSDAALVEQPLIPKTLLLTSQYQTLELMREPQRSNVKRMTELNQDLRVLHMNNDACRQYLSEKRNDLLDQFDRSLQHAFGKFASDVCRTVYLYYEGGFYLDNDLELTLPLRQLVNEDTAFMSGWQANPLGAQNESLYAIETEPGSRGLTNNLIGIRPRSQILQHAMDEMVQIRPPGIPGIENRSYQETRIAHGGMEWNQNWGPETLYKGFRRFYESCTGISPQKFSQESVCGEQVRLYYEASFDNKSHYRELDSILEKSIRAQLQTRTGNNRAYAIVDLGAEQRLVGWPRCSGCNVNQTQDPALRGRR